MNKIKKKNKWIKPLILIISIILFLYSFALFVRVNIGASLIVLAIIGAGIYKFGEDAMHRKMSSFETWVGIELDDKKERLTEIEDKLYDLEDEEYDVNKDGDIPHSKKEFIDKLKKEKEALEERVKRIKQNFPELNEE